MRNYLKSELFLKYTLSYLCILLIPLLLLTVLMYHNAAGNLREEIERSNLNQLTQAKTIIDGRMKELDQIASQMAYDQQLTSYRAHHPYYSFEAVQALEKYQSISSIIGDMFLFFHGDDTIYSADGTSSLNVFTDQFAFRNWNPDQLIDDMNNVTFPTIRPADMVTLNTTRQQSLLSYMVPITPNNPHPYGTVLFLIPEQELTGLISSILGNYQGMTYIFDNNGQILANNRNGETLTDPEAAEIAGLESGIHNRIINDEQHSVVTVKSEDNGWSYVTLMPSDQFFSSVIHIRSFILILFTAVLLIGTIMAILFARKQVHPIFDLAQYAYSTSTTSKDVPYERKGNELEHIRRALQEQNLRANLHEPYARNHYLLMMLKYGQSGRMIPKKLMDTLGIQFDRSHYFALITEWKDTSLTPLVQPERMNTVSQMTDMEFPTMGARVYGVELTQTNQMAFIVGFDDDQVEGSADRYHRLVEAIHERITKLVGTPPEMGAGSFYQEATSLSQSFIEAYSAHESRLVNGNNVIAFFEELSFSQDEAFWISKDVLLKLSQSLKQGNYDVAKQTISTAIETLQSQQMPLQLMRCISFDLLNILLKTASELGIHSVIHDIRNPSDFHSTQDLEHYLQTIASFICVQVESNEETEERSLMDQIVTYIDEHYTEYELSLETISQEFSISTSYFSRSFKEKVGVNFSQYIWQKRMQEVIHQLTTSSDPLKEIITRVGYQDTPNFIRKFKKETGHTPGQYRKLHASAEDDQEITNVQER
ncbi:AraC family transcriptional regulator [Paenibacillus sp. Marseille-Q4541]|uniref:AraC family transcriptional regulator n=1 Tax=Paenibacillus sp. Marseille-Q4541 TaxID=2831522 RepID=UPI001BA66E44|nr:AraC family transcriptional regulator [Paenibacillus sp. Marseille-Q4541]